MKRDRIWTCLIAAALSFLLATGAVGCLATAFKLTLSGGTVLFFGAAALVCSFLFSFRYGGWLILGGLALSAGYLWRGTDLLLQTEALVNHISDYYNRGYGWGLISWSGEPLEDVVIRLPFGVVGCLILLVTAWAVVHKAKAFWTVLAAAVPLGFCVVLTDTVPGPPYLAMTLFALVMLLMTQTIRKQNVREANRLVTVLLIPLALALALLFIAVPQEGYTPPPEDLAQRTVEWFQDLRLGENLVEKITTAFSDSANEKVDLKNSGPRGQQRFKVMEVTAAVDGPLYLRGRVYDTYDGYNWTVSDGDAWGPDYEDLYRSSTLGEVTITTNSVHEVLYTPYNTDTSVTDRMDRGKLINEERLKTYSFTQYDGGMQWDPADGARSTQTSSWTEWALRDQFLALPYQTKQDAEEYLNLCGFSSTFYNLHSDVIYPDDALTVLSKAEYIAEQVRASATYDLNTKRMPSGETDFVLWFLEDSDTGYCVHFASAATVLLRAAGIPARYVTGYLADGVAGEPVTVRGADAHAWVEYWLPGMGWTILEATPSVGAEAPGETTEAATPPEESTGSEETDPPARTDPPDEPDSPTDEQPDIDGPGEDTPDAPRPGLPGLPGGEGDGSAIDLSWLWPILGWIGKIAAVIALLWGQWYLRLRLHRRWLEQGNANEQALRRWREIKLLCRLLRQPPPEELEQLALKAKFSQYILDEQELHRFHTRRTELIERLRAKDLYWHILYRLVLAIY